MPSSDDDFEEDLPEDVREALERAGAIWRNCVTQSLSSTALLRPISVPRVIEGDYTK